MFQEILGLFRVSSEVSAPLQDVALTRCNKGTVETPDEGLMFAQRNLRRWSLQENRRSEILFFLFQIHQIEKFFFVVHMHIFTQVYSAKACDGLSVLWCLYPWKCQILIFRGGECASGPWFQSKQCSIDSVMETLFLLPSPNVCLLNEISFYYINTEETDDIRDAEFTGICNLESRFSSFMAKINNHQCCNKFSILKWY